MSKSKIAELEKLLQATRQTAEQAIERATNAIDQRTAALTDARTYREQRDNAIKERDQAQRDFGDLKHRLYMAEMEVARLRGFIERVHEQDKADDPDVIVERTEHHRPDRSPLRRVHPENGCNTTDAITNRPRHWTSYGH